MRLLLLLACTLSTALAQRLSDLLPAPQTITYEGVVIDATTAVPISGVTVTIAFDRRPLPPLTTSTDAAGRFAITAPYPKPHEDQSRPLKCSKPGYFEALYAFSPGHRVQDGDGNVRVSQMIVRLTAYATISGEILDASGKAAPGTRVTLMALGGPGSSGVATSDLKGRFRAEVTPGGYFICAEPSGQKSIATCYPSAANYDSATVVIVHPGEAAGPFTIRMPDEPRYTIRGQIRSLVPKTATWGESIWAIPLPDEPGPHGSGYLYSCVNRDGSFLIPGLRAGRYVVRATAGPEVQRNPCAASERPTFFNANSGFDDVGPPRLRAPEYTSSETVAVSADIKDLVVKVGRGARVTGHVVFKD